MSEAETLLLFITINMLVAKGKLWVSGLFCRSLPSSGKQLHPAIDQFEPENLTKSPMFPPPKKN